MTFTLNIKLLVLNKKNLLIILIPICIVTGLIFLLPYSSDLDNFGIKKLYPTELFGRNWHANWDNGKERKFESVQKDPYDSSVQLRGNGKISIDGKGIASLSGETPRIYVLDKSKPKWTNVEITFYAKRISETNEISHQGFVAGARSEHQDADKNKCLGATYYGRFLYDGDISFQKELVHGEVFSERFPNLDKSNSMSTNQDLSQDGEKKFYWNSTGGYLPKNIWVGIKFIVFSHNDVVKLELYRDLTDGLNGGKWEKITEFLDTGDNISFNSNYDIEKKCGFNEKVILQSGNSVFLRNDGIEKALYKKFSVREISLQ